MPDRKQAEEWLEENSCTLESGVIVWNERKNKNMATKTKKVAKKVSKKAPVKTKLKKADPIVPEPQDLKVWKIAQKEYQKYYNLGLKYAKEYNKIVMTQRKNNTDKKNREQVIGWTDGFVDEALSGFYDGVDGMADYDHFPNAGQPRQYDFSSDTDDWTDEA